MDASSIEEDVSREEPEDLMLVGTQDQEVGVAMAVIDGLKGDGDIARRAAELPGLQEDIAAALIHRNIEFDVVEFEGATRVEDHVLAGFGRIPEAIAEVPAKGLAIQKGIQGRPIPGVLIGPDSPAPIQNAIATVVHVIDLFAELGIAAGFEAIDLLVVIEMPRLLEGGGDDHRIGEGLFEVDVAMEGFFLIAEFLHVAKEVTLLPFMTEFHGKALLLVFEFDVSGGGAFRKRKTGLGEHADDRLGDVFGGAPEIEHRDRGHVHVAVVVDRQGNAVILVADIVIIPFLEARILGGHQGAVILLDEGEGIAGFGKVAVAIKQNPRGQSMLFHNSLPSCAAARF